MPTISSYAQVRELEAMEAEAYADEKQHQGQAFGKV
jgi:hypothetical protein